jgi:hypothetical protein
LTLWGGHTITFVLLGGHLCPIGMAHPSSPLRVSVLATSFFFLIILYIFFKKKVASFYLYKMN